MHRSRLQDREPFTTLDGSTIREIAHPAWTAAAQPEPGRGDGARRAATTTAHLPPRQPRSCTSSPPAGAACASATTSSTSPPATARSSRQAPSTRCGNTGRGAARAPVLLRARLLPRGHRHHGRPGAQGPGAAPTPRRDAPVPHDARGPGRRAGGRARPRRPRRGGVAAAAPGRRAAGRHQRAERHRLRRPDVPPPGPALRAPRRPLGPRAGPRPPAHRDPPLGRPRARAPAIEPHVAFGAPRRTDRRNRARRCRASGFASGTSARVTRACRTFTAVERGQPLPRADRHRPAAGAAYYATAQVECRGRAASSPPTSSTMPSLDRWMAGFRGGRRGSRGCGGCTTTMTATTTCTTGTQRTLRFPTRPRPDLVHRDRRHRRAFVTDRNRHLPREPATHAAARAALPLRPCRPAMRAAYTRIYVYHWYGGRAGCRHAGTPRSSAPDGAHAARLHGRASAAAAAGAAPSRTVAAREQPRAPRRPAPGAARAR